MTAERFVATLIRWRPALLAVGLAAVCAWLFPPSGSLAPVPTCAVSASPALEAIAAVPVDEELQYEGRDPRRDCLSTIETPDSDETRRIFVLRDERSCSGDHCRTEVWQELRAGVYRPALYFAMWTRGAPEMENGGAIPILHFAGQGDAGPHAFRLVYSLIESSYFPLDRGSGADSDVRPMRFERTARGLFAEGEITATSALYLEQAVRDLGIGQGTTLFLDSGGGSSRGGLELGRTIRRLGLATDVARPDGDDRVEWGECLSACAYAFMGGARRQLTDRSRLAFHGPRQMRGMVTGDAGEEAVALVDDPEAFRAHRERLAEYLRDNGFAEGLADRILTVAATQMCSMTAGEMAGYGILGNPTGAVPPAEPMTCWSEDDPPSPAPPA